MTSAKTTKPKKKKTTKVKKKLKLRERGSNSPLIENSETGGYNDLSVNASANKRKKKTKKAPATTSALSRNNSNRKRMSNSTRPLSTTGSKFFPSTGASASQLEQKVTDLETRIKDLVRDNQVLSRKLEQSSNRTNKKTKTLNSEKDMRLAANKERYWLRQKLNRLQLAIEARLKMLGIDFSNINDLGEALEAAFAAIQKLAAELAKKEEELQMMNDRFDRTQEQMNARNAEMDKLSRKMNKLKNSLNDRDRELRDRDAQLEQAAGGADNAADAQSKARREIARLKAALEKLRNQKNEQFDNFVDEKAELENSLREKNQELEDSQHGLQAANKKNHKLLALNEKLQGEMDRMRALMEKQMEKLMEMKERNKENQSAKDEEIAQMKLHMQQQNDENEALKQKMAEMEQRLKEMEETIEDQDEELADYKRQMEEERAAKEALLKQQEQDSEENQETNNLLQNSLNDANAANEALKAKNAEKDAELDRLRKALEEAQQGLDDYKNRPKEDKATQTDINGTWFDNAAMQLANIDALNDENGRLRDLATRNDERLIELADENLMLLDEIDQLLKQQAQFKPDTSNHRGEILSLCASPGAYAVATTATDKSVRIWKIDPSQAKAKDQVKVALRSQMEGVALSLAYTRDGKYLCAGCAYKNGPDGLLIVWDMTLGDGEVQFLFRSRPSIRFGRAHCVCWSDNSQYIFSGDTTGTIWVWDVVRQIQLAMLKLHSDVVHDIGVARGTLFSCSLDQSISTFALSKLSTVKVKKSKVHVHKPKVFKGVELDRNAKYPYWKIAPTPDCKFVLAGSRKVANFSVAEGKEEHDDCALGKAARVTDSDMDHIQSLSVQRNLVSICRKNTPRAKIFDVKTGREQHKAKFKGPVSKINFLHDFQRAVVCVQKYNGKKALAPTMHLWHYAK